MIDTPTQQVKRPPVATKVERFWLVPVLESEEITSFPLSEGPLKIGSDSSCEICLPVSGVEPFHAAIHVERGKPLLAAQSRMTWINNGPVREAVLKPGQRLAIGPVEFRVEQRSESHPLPPLHQVEALQQYVAEEYGQIEDPAPRSDRMAAWNSPDAERATFAILGTPPSQSPRRDAADHHSNRDEVERRRALVRELQASLHDQAAATLQSLNDATAAHRQNHAEMERVRSELSEMRATLAAERDSLVREREELNRRSSRLQEDEQRLCTRQAELEQTIEQLKQERRDQYERESLLQLRIEEINRNDGDLAEREAALHQGQKVLAEQQTTVAAQASSHGDLSMRDAAVTEREQEVERRTAALEDRETALGQRAADLDRREKDLAVTAAADQQRITAEREELSAARVALETEQAELACERKRHQAAAQSQADETAHQLTEEVNELRQSLADQRARLDEDRNQLAGENAALRQQRESLEHAHSEVQRAQDEIRQQLTSIESARAELGQEREQLEQEREQLRREQEAFAAKRDEAAAERERTAAARAASPADTSHTDEMTVSEIVDEYEVMEAASETDEDQLAEEIVEDGEVAGTPEDRSGLRSQLAELFGMSSDDLTARARRREAPVDPQLPASQPDKTPVDSDQTDEADGVQEAASASEPEPAVSLDEPNSPNDTAEVQAEESEEHDSIAAYMEKLLARTRRGPQPTIVVAPAPPAPPKHRERTQSESDIDGGTFDDESQEASPKVPRKRQDSKVERANIDAFRDLANRSARSAVAKHHSISLRNRFLAKAVVTGLLFVLSVGLLTADLWFAESYVIWGFLAAAGMCASAFDLLKMVARMQSNKVQQFEPAEDQDDVQDPLFRVVELFARVAEQLTWKRSGPPPEEQDEMSEVDDMAPETSVAAADR